MIDFEQKVCDIVNISCSGVGDLSLSHAAAAVVVGLALIVVALIYFKGGDEPLIKGFGPSRPKRSHGNELGSSDLASTHVLKEWIRKPDKLDTPLFLTDVKGNTGVAFKKGFLSIPNNERNRHILIIAKTGGGKTTKVILPILYADCLCPERSTIVIDSKPEMWGKLAGMTRKFNPKKNIMLFNPLDTVRSLSWNIVSKVENDSDAKLIANTLIMATDVPSAKGDSPFFRNNALQLLNAMMVGLLNDPNDKLSIPRIHELLHSGKNALCDWLEAHPHAIRNSRTFVELARSGSQNADTVLSELGMRLSAWDLHAIRATTAFEELDLEKLITEPTLLIVELRESEIEMLRPLANTIVIELLRYLTKRAETFPGARLPRPVGFVIDEFASALGRLPDIHVKLNTLRSRNVSIVAAIQSIGQIKANYQTDADSVIAGFSTKILIPQLDFQDAEWASKETGTMTIRYKTASTGTNKKITEHFASRNKGMQEQVQQRAVLTPDEIGRPIDDSTTFFLPNVAPFQAHITPYYKIPEMEERLTKYEGLANELKLREGPIEYEEKLPEPVYHTATGESKTESQIREELENVKKELDWDGTTGVAREWWEAFEQQNASHLGTVLMLAEELKTRKATITEFFLAYVYSDVDSVEENLKYLDKMREDRAKAEAEGTEQAAEPPAENVA